MNGWQEMRVRGTGGGGSSSAGGGGGAYTTHPTPRPILPTIHTHPTPRTHSSSASHSHPPMTMLTWHKHNIPPHSDTAVVCQKDFMYVLTKSITLLCLTANCRRESLGKFMVSFFLDVRVLGGSRYFTGESEVL
ncbi:hypothetical protein O3P69_008014 [Scylla paramamosain]|uniref:Uncharacterized protein n=1 Tax=Scylla paramamosain TaxID=85552 RepID=A0AAW0T197_SCYPA